MCVTALINLLIYSRDRHIYMIERQKRIVSVTGRSLEVIIRENL
jgi:hypothetical protein